MVRIGCRVDLSGPAFGLTLHAQLEALAEEYLDKYETELGGVEGLFDKVILEVKPVLKVPWDLLMRLLDRTGLGRVSVASFRPFAPLLLLCAANAPSYDNLRRRDSPEGHLINRVAKFGATDPAYVEESLRSSAQQPEGGAQALSFRESSSEAPFVSWLFKTSTANLAAAQLWLAFTALDVHRSGVVG